MYHQFDNLPDINMSKAPRKARKTQCQSLKNARPSTIQTRASTIGNLNDQQNTLRYNTSHMRTHNAPYPMTDQRAQIDESNQVLYPNMHHVENMQHLDTPIGAYPMQQQLPQQNCRSVQIEQPAMPRYNTRRAVHNLPLPSAPTMNRFWNNSRPPVTQINTPTPVERPLPKQTKDISVQTEFSLTDTEMKLVKTLQCNRMDASKVIIKMENGRNIISYSDTVPDEDDPDENGNNKDTINKEAYKQIISCSDSHRNQLLQYAIGLHRMNAFKNFVPNLPMLQMGDGSTDKGEPLVPGYFKNGEQQLTVPGPQSIPADVEQDNNSANTEPARPGPRTRSQANMKTATNSGAQSCYPIPSITTGNLYRSNPPNYCHPTFENLGIPRMPDMPMNFLQAAAMYFGGQPNMHLDFNRFRMPGSFSKPTFPTFPHPYWRA